MFLRLYNCNMTEQPTPVIEVITVRFVAAITGITIVVFMNVTVFIPFFHQELFGRIRNELSGFIHA